MKLVRMSIRRVSVTSCRKLITATTWGRLRSRYLRIRDAKVLDHSRAITRQHRSAITAAIHKEEARNNKQEQEYTFSAPAFLRVSASVADGKHQVLISVRRRTNTNASIRAATRQPSKARIGINPTAPRVLSR